MSGNRRPQVFPDCANCGQRFGPRDRRSHRFCSLACARAAERVEGPRSRQRPTTEARRAQRRIRHLVDSGQVAKPECCEECGEAKRLEAAHYDYAEPERVRWLCTSCHRRWDRAEPKGGTER